MYAGESKDGGLPRPLAQVFKLHFHYTQYAKRMRGEDYEDYDEQLAQIYEDTVIKGSGLYLMLVRNSSDYARIQTSEYNRKFFQLRPNFCLD